MLTSSMFISAYKFVSLFLIVTFLNSGDILVHRNDSQTHFRTEPDSYQDMFSEVYNIPESSIYQMFSGGKIDVGGSGFLFDRKAAINAISVVKSRKISEGHLSVVRSYDVSRNGDGSSDVKIHLWVKNNLSPQIKIDSTKNITSTLSQLSLVDMSSDLNTIKMF